MPKWKVNNKLTYYVKTSTANKIRLAYEYLVGYGDRVPISLLNEMFRVPPEWIERMHILGIITVESKFNYFSYINAKNPIMYFARVANKKKAMRLFKYLDKPPQKSRVLNHNETSMIDQLKKKLNDDAQKAMEKGDERYTTDLEDQES